MSISILPIGMRSIGVEGENRTLAISPSQGDALNRLSYNHHRSQPLGATLDTFIYIRFTNVRCVKDKLTVVGKVHVVFLKRFLFVNQVDL